MNIFSPHSLSKKPSGKIGIRLHSIHNRLDTKSRHLFLRGIGGRIGRIRWSIQKILDNIVASCGAIIPVSHKRGDWKVFSKSATWIRYIVDLCDNAIFNFSHCFPPSTMPVLETRSLKCPHWKNPDIFRRKRAKSGRFPPIALYPEDFRIVVELFTSSISGPFGALE